MIRYLHIVFMCCIKILHVVFTCYDCVDFWNHLVFVLLMAQARIEIVSRELNSVIGYKWKPQKSLSCNTVYIYVHIWYGPIVSVFLFLQAYNEPRRCLRKYFKNRKCFTFDRPASAKKMQQLEKCSDEDLSEDFVEQVGEFLQYVYTNCPTKKLETGQEINGRSKFHIQRVSQSLKSWEEKISAQI